jgi:hypothetical protein
MTTSNAGQTILERSWSRGGISHKTAPLEWRELRVDSPTAAKFCELGPAAFP